MNVPETIISLNQVSKHYSVDSRSGVSNISLTINKGDFVAIVGESGSGKSTLLKLIYGLLSPNAGNVLFKGEQVLGPHEKLIPGHDRMKMVTQDFNLNLYAKVYDNIAAMLSNEDVKSKQQKTWEMMEFLGIDQLSDKRIVELSGGEQQRIAIARAIITEPDVLLLDEPFSQVDAVLKTQLRADLKRLSAYLGITIILVSHDPADGMSLADMLIILRGGKILQSGKPKDIYNQPLNLYTARLLGNAVMLTAEQAARLGLHTKQANAVFYPEWVQLKSSWSSRRYIVKQVFFRGFYDELALERNEVEIRAISISSGSCNKGDKVSVVITHFLGLEQD